MSQQQRGHLICVVLFALILHNKYLFFFPMRLVHELL